MHFDRSAVQGNRLEFDGDNLFLLQAGKDPVEHPRLAPAVHSRINSVSIPQGFLQSPPFAAMFSHIQNGVEHLQIVQAHIATLARQTIGNPQILTLGDFHPPSLAQSTL